MMNKLKTGKAWRWKVAAFLPLLALLLMAFGKPGEKVNSEKKRPLEMVPPIVQDSVTKPEHKYLKILIDAEGKVSTNISGLDKRQQLLTRMGETYNIQFSLEELRTFSTIKTFGLPINLMKAFLDMPAEERNKPGNELGIPFDSPNNEFKNWVSTARKVVGHEMRVIIMGDPSVSYEVIKKLMGTLQDLNENRYSLFANLELVKGQIREIVMPSKVSPVPNPYQVKASRAITIILDKDYSVYYYEGTHDPATGIDPVVTKTDLSLSGIHKYLANKNSDVIAKIQDLEKKKERNELSEADFEKQRKEIISDKSAPIVIIKATNASNYGNLVNILDEMGICNIGRYAIIDVTDYDKNLISKAGLLKQIPPPPPPPLQNQKEQKSQIKITPPPIFIEIKKEGVFLMKNLVTLDEFRKQLPLVVKNNPQSEVWINVKDKSNPDIQAVKNIVKEAGVSKWEYW